MRLKIPTNFRIIRVPCTGKVDIIHILRAFEKGADGVYVVGCMEGDCHYNQGNFRARKRVEQAARVLEMIGVGGDRVRMYNLSSGEGPLFAQYSTEMVNRVREMGPSPIRLAKQRKTQKADAA
ncbi:MAG: hydrogenase iron-sulfur subunit [Desulfotignum balticum]|jgi:coenzyme F420-reducing hydrogenase delta subunit|uniref:Hydrogenase iron-sulfur subunit n=1 Tax=Desulfotignum balticum TaxID=115781 RepID=A0A931GB31_9BACT|nr:hydrogenase iron-sulfur subunit [Desulfotignum balticum]